EAVFRQDPILAYHLLRLVNSLCIGVDKHISSFSQAILILGRHQLKRWLNLMLFAANRDDYRTPMLMARVAVRARSMELLAKAGGFDRSEQDQAFMAGMFSLLGVLFGMPLSEVL
ncbi:MAG: HDOD domain-containing protein, partial [Deltaproteobacteria bacterium]|nr:HDOD domain-containing protein [Deltaproteobacteria bacterium]